MRRRVTVFGFLLAVCLLAACSSPSSQASSPGIDGTWVAPLQPDGSITIALHPGAGCTSSGPCALTGTLKDDRDGMNGPLSDATINGNTVSFHPLLKLTSADLTGRQYDFTGTLQPNGTEIKGELKVKGTAEQQAQTFNVDFKKQ